MGALTHTAVSRRHRLAAFWSSLDRSQRQALLMMVLVVVGLHVAGFLTLIALVAPHRYRVGSAGAFTVGAFWAWAAGEAARQAAAAPQKSRRRRASRRRIRIMRAGLPL